MYGGAHVGLMGAVADAVLEGGGHAHGVIPYGLTKLEVGHTGLSGLDVVDTLHERKARMDELSDAFLALPGGHGTFEELFEALTWLQLGIHGKPVCLVNLDGYYDALIAQLDRCVTEGFIRPENRALLLVAESVTEGLRQIEEWQRPDRAAWQRPPS